MTYLELRDKINELPLEQQSQPVAFMGSDRHGGNIVGLWVAEEDHVNPSGDGDEPISTYANDPWFHADEEKVTIKKGTALLFEE